MRGGVVAGTAPALPARALLIVSVRAYREPLAGALESAGLEVVGAVKDTVSALPWIAELEPDVVALEAITPEQRWAIGGIKAAAPQARLVALGVADRPADLVALVEAGASGYVTSDQSVEEAAAVLRSVARGELPCSGRVAAILASRLSDRSVAAPAPDRGSGRLTARELEIAGLIASGLSNKEIASILSIELATVKNHVHHILVKLGATRRSEVASRVSSAIPQWSTLPGGSDLSPLDA